MKKEEARKVIAALVVRFEEQYDSYKRSDYSEALVRKDFIDPFFKALGWDMDNSQGYAEAYREVIHEDKVKVAKTLKAPDYSFKLSGGKRLFFVEAKKPFVKLKSEIEPAYQLRRYAWSAKLPISILTDFEEFSVYDCTKRPNATDSAALGRIKYLTFRDYINEFDFLWEAFSKEHVLKGSFDKYVKSDKGKRGTATVDNAFLESLDSWRTYLATSIAKNNPKLTEDELNFTVQHAIDRIIFLRIAEDRGVEPYGQLSAAMKEGGNLYQNLFGLFQEADRKYNSGLFDFKKDRVSEKLIIDNKVVRSIVEELYYPKSPYEFSVLSVEILGSAYEQFLGKRIRMDSGHRARIEEKPEVRKAGGVYYTPQYIVDYIVQHTVGELVKGKSPKEVAVLRIVDPACGSGSFLLGAFQFLLDWHRNYYSAQAKPNRGKKDDVLRPDGQLTTSEKKRILLNNIFGVDLDANAVEVTKLSLLLKCMEGKTEASIKQQLGMFHDRVLPTLDENIKCGNSLIDQDYYDGKLDLGEDKNIRPFTWKASFPEVFKKHGGFHAVIGNPPYIRVQLLQGGAGVVEYLSGHYRSASKGNYDIYVVFIEKALQIANDAGKVGYILPHKFFNADYGAGVRAVLKESTSVESIVHFGHQQVFDGATTYTCLLMLGKGSKRRDLTYARIEDLEAWRVERKEPDKRINYSSLGKDNWIFLSGPERTLFDRLKKSKLRLDTVTDRIFQGLKTSADKIYIVGRVKEDHKHYWIHCPMNGEQYKVERDLFHPLIKGGDSKGFFLTQTEAFILFPYVPDKSGAVGLIPFADLAKKYPLTAAYLSDHKKYLSDREDGAFKGASWHQFGRSQALDVVTKRKLFTPDLSPKAAFGLDPVGDLFFTGGVAGGYGLLVKKGYSDLYLLGLLNSHLLDWCVRPVSTQMRGGWWSYESRYIADLPIVIGTDRQQKEVIALAESMTKLKADALAAKLPNQVEQLQQRIDHTEERLNAAVYEIYGLSKQEVEMVEGSFSKEL